MARKRSKVLIDLGSTQESYGDDMSVSLSDNESNGFEESEVCSLRFISSYVYFAFSNFPYIDIPCLSMFIFCFYFYFLLGSMFW